MGGNVPYAVFKAKKAERVRYRVCVNRPVGSTKCKTKRTGRRGALSLTKVRVNSVGTYRAKFKVRGRVVAKGKMELVAENV